MENSTVTVKFQHPVTHETFEATRTLENGRNFSLERFDREENGWVYCGEVTPYTPAPVRDALLVQIGHELFLDSFTHEQKCQMVGTRL